jgi:LysM repeat protein
MICPKGTISYQIKPGDTFYSLARKFNTTAEAIASVNTGVNPNNLKPGVLICIPIRRSVVSCPPANRYVIKAGDTFSKLAGKYHLSTASLISLNPGVDPTNLRIGQMICLPVRRRRRSH